MEMHHRFSGASVLHQFRFTVLIQFEVGEYTKELFIDRRENSKSLAWSSIRLAFQNVELGKVYQRPKAVGDIRGISYSYSLLWRFGVIRVPETVENKLHGKKR